MLEACTGREAVAIAHTAQFDGALTDLGLPDMPGESVITYIRAVSGRRTPVAVLSSASEGELVRAVELGADRVFPKPVDWETPRRDLASWTRWSSPSPPTARC